ncbi:MAG: PDDEXK nuclease domain-containing protein [Verrucomicrobiota bacterium]
MSSHQKRKKLSSARPAKVEFFSIRDYGRFFSALKQRIAHARIFAARVVNRELILLYWDIGRAILIKQQTAGWGDAVVVRLSADLAKEYPDMRGFSPDNLWRMRQFAAEYSSADFLEQLVPESAKRRQKSHRNWSREIVTADHQIPRAASRLITDVPWGHHLELLKKIKSPAARLYYLRATAQFGWSRNILLNQIKAGTYERQLKEKKTHNFKLALPADLAGQAGEVLKSRYCLEFLGLKRTLKERALERRLTTHLQQFLLELGYGFCFVARQHRLTLGTKEYYVDLLFYHRFLKALIAFDLKIGPFEPEHAGKMDFYLNLLNEAERAPNDRPSIGIILCAEKDDIEVEFALKTKNNPIGVAEYQLQSNLPKELQGRLPSAKQLVDAIREVLPARLIKSSGAPVASAKSMNGVKCQPAGCLSRGRGQTISI